MPQNNILKLSLFSLFLTILLSGFLFFPAISYGADRYWVGAGTGATANWNTTASWSTTSGGASGASVPGVSDAAIFDGGGSKTGGVVIDAAVNVISITATTGYTGIGTNDGHINNATNNQTITVSGNVTLDNKQVSMGTATWTVSGNWDHQDVTTFNYNLSTLVLNGTSKTINGGGTAASTRLNNLTISGTISTVTTGFRTVSTLDVSGTLTVNNNSVVGGNVTVQTN